MSGKTVWVVGGLVLAIGAVAYLSYHETPAGKDAAGTIVAAKRAYVDGTSGSGSGAQSGSPNSGSDSGSGSAGISNGSDADSGAAAKRGTDADSGAAAKRGTDADSGAAAKK